MMIHSFGYTLGCIFFFKFVVLILVHIFLYPLVTLSYVFATFNYIDYLFLGDYVDHSQHSLETITLLLALKIEYPHNIRLIRGNHEATDINALFRFHTECIERMIENLQRPITMETGAIVLMDLLWSDPTENDSVEGLRPNAKGPGLVTFGVSDFMFGSDHFLLNSYTMVSNF
ncbi:hypothetical protein ZIOFF_075000 [Zingiber officinale]|uniref:Serine/threonine-protein phosphatase n=1 Tax=Zingiber officinale TaxID=94328 RepID=A0A8J5ESV2_ZINOF|nr:hypothetical protein ZIOFF_075000 [Zingiber officinale]